MKTRHTFLFLFVLISFGIQSCATLDTTKKTFSKNIGTIEKSGIDDIITRLQNRYNYEIERNETYTNDEIHLRTYWKKDSPFSNTANDTVRAKEVETRIIIRTQKKSSQGYQLFRVKFLGEYRALLPNEDGEYDFRNVELTQGAKEYFQEISTDLEDRISGSIKGSY